MFTSAQVAVERGGGLRESFMYPPDTVNQCASAMADITRVKTGVMGLDDLLNGGIPEHHSVLLAGPAGSGKTTIALEYLYNGATKFAENGLYVSFEESEESIIADLPFDWDLKGLMEEGKISVVKYDPYQYEDIIDLIRTSVKSVDAKRVVVDSLTALSLYVEDVKDVRKLILDLNEQLRQLECTSLYTGEIKSEHPEQISRFGVEEFIADGVIVLSLDKTGAELSNKILVRKMRGTSHDKKTHPFRFGEDGVVVYAKEEAFEAGATPSSTPSIPDNDEF